MNIAVVGTGYVGLVSGACFAETGAVVTCVDIDKDKVERLTRGEIPIYEPGLDELVLKNIKAGRLKFTTSLADILNEQEVVFCRRHSTRRRWQCRFKVCLTSCTNNRRTFKPSFGSSYKEYGACWNV